MESLKRKKNRHPDFLVLQKQYQKGNDLVVVQPQQRTRATDDTVIVLMRFYNLREKGGS